jgi:iron(III) transport system ATP-binding protein
VRRAPGRRSREDLGVEIKNLRKEFGKTSALDDISLQVQDGKLLSILGPSGSGKTTLLRCIAGVETPEAGVIKLGSKTVFDSSKGVNVPPEERGIGMVFQSNALWPHMTVKKNVAYPLEVRRDDNADTKVSKVLSLLKMDGLAERYPNELSGGEQQRVAIARAIVYRPSLVLLDEPFSNLDVLLRESLRDELRQLQLKLGMTMVYVTHDRVDALSLGDDLAILSGGRLMAFGHPDSLLKSPPNSYTARFLDGMLTIDGDASRLSSGQLRVGTNLGAFDVPSEHSTGRVKLCVPPSACRLERVRADGSIPGTVAGTARFPSGLFGVRVTTEAGVVEVRLEPGGTIPLPGDQVFLIIDSKECILLDV